MRKTLTALAAAAVLGTATIANPTPARAVAPGVVVAIVAALVVATAVTVQAAQPRGHITVKAKGKKKKM